MDNSNDASTAGDNNHPEEEIVVEEQDLSYNNEANDYVNPDEDEEAEDPHGRRRIRTEREPEQETNSSTDASIPQEKTPCCDVCAKGEGRKKGCVCIIPGSQRRAILNVGGCLHCHCLGCHPEDIQKRKNARSNIGEQLTASMQRLTPDDTSSRRERDSSSSTDEREQLRNGCCKACMKAFSSNHKACLCQVPADVRVAILPPNGCKVCGCKGCHPDELMMRQRGQIPNRNRIGSNPRQQRSNQMGSNMGMIGMSMTHMYPPPRGYEYTPPPFFPMYPPSDPYGMARRAPPFFQPSMVPPPYPPVNAYYPPPPLNSGGPRRDFHSGGGRYDDHRSSRYDNSQKKRKESRDGGDRNESKRHRD